MVLEADIHSIAFFDFIIENYFWVKLEILSSYCL